MDVSFIGHAGIQYRDPDTIAGDSWLPDCAGPCQVRSDSARRGAQAALDLVVERDSRDTRVARQVLQRTRRGPCRHYRNISEGHVRDRAGVGDGLSPPQCRCIRSSFAETRCWAACFLFHELDQDPNWFGVRHNHRHGGFHLVDRALGGRCLRTPGTRGLTVQADRNNKHRGSSQ